MKNNVDVPAIIRFRSLTNLWLLLTIAGCGRPVPDELNIDDFLPAAVATSFVKSGEPLDESTLLKFEAEIGHRLPPDYRAILKLTNGGVFKTWVTREPDVPIEWISDCGAKDYFGIDVGKDYLDLREVRLMMSTRIPERFLPIADSDGQLICIAIHGPQTGQIFVYDFIEQATKPPEKNMYFVAKSFRDYLSKLRPETTNT